MLSLPSFLIACYFLGALISTVVGFWQTKINKNPFGLTPWLLLPYGVFVWGDAVILGAFWSCLTFISLITNNLYFFLLVQSLFWIVRSLGEIVYWFLQQFASKKRDLPNTLRGHTFFPGESIWFAYQLLWQIVLIIASLSLIYLLRGQLLF